jgi:hypothetical protein
MEKGSAQHALCCPCGRPEIFALGLCPSCYTMKRPGRSILRRPTRSGPRARRLPLSRVRGVGSRETQDHRASSRPWRLPVGTDDLTVSRVPCQGRAHEDGARGDDTAAARAVATATPEGHEQVMLAFQRERANSSSGSADIRRSSKRNCKA